MTGISADLHIHSIYSDGLTDVTDIIKHAVKNKLDYISITDHDTADAYSESYECSDVSIIPGIEFSARYSDYSVHVLGYFKTVSDMENEIDERIEDRKRRASEMINKINDMGFRINISDIKREAEPSRVLGRPHIARAMVNMGLAGSFDEVFRKYIGNNAPCYVRKKEYTVEETVQLIHENRGIAVIAHPDISGITHILDDIIECGIDGIEVFNNNAAGKRKNLIEFARKNSMIITGGSDYHGNEDYMPQGLLKHYAEDFMTQWRKL